MLKINNDFIGRHVILEINECNNKKMKDIETIEQIITEAALTAGTEIKEVIFKKVNNQSIIGVVMTAETNLTIHICPEIEYAAVNLFTYNKRVDPFAAVDLITERFEAEITKVDEIKRGNRKENKLGSLIHFC